MTTTRIWQVVAITMLLAPAPLPASAQAADHAPPPAPTEAHEPDSESKDAPVAAPASQTHITEGAALGPQPDQALVWTDLIAARFNPLGLENRLGLWYRARLYDDPGILWRDAWVALGFTPILNPAVALVGGSLEVKPLTPILISASYYWVQFFGTFEFLQSYRSAREAHADSDLDQGKDRGRNYATSGTQLDLRCQLLGKLGPVVLRNTLVLTHYELDLRRGDRLAYTPRLDFMVPDGGWSLINDTDLVYLSDAGLVAGVRTTVVQAFYRHRHFLATEALENPNGPVVRTGPLFAYTFHDEPGGLLDKATALIIINWYLKHRYRTGEDVHQAVPYLILGVNLGGNLWSP